MGEILSIHKSNTVGECGLLREWLDHGVLVGLNEKCEASTSHGVRDSAV